MICRVPVPLLFAMLVEGAADLVPTPKRRCQGVDRVGCGGGRLVGGNGTNMAWVPSDSG